LAKGLEDGTITKDNFEKENDRLWDRLLSRHAPATQKGQ
jgi:hypothetical protein